jgi:hypothetical protein
MTQNLNALSKIKVIKDGMFRADGNFFYYNGNESSYLSSLD